MQRGGVGATVSGHHFVHHAQGLVRALHFRETRYERVVRALPGEPFVETGEGLQKIVEYGQIGGDELEGVIGVEETAAPPLVEEVAHRDEVSGAAGGID